MSSVIQPTIGREREGEGERLMDILVEPENVGW